MSNTFHGHNGQIQLSNEAVVITRKGVLGLVTLGLAGEKRIPYSSISAVQFKEGGIFVNGYIQLSILGGLEARGGTLNATQDENTVMFRKSQNQEFARLRAEIERRVATAKSPAPINVGSLSVAEQLSKLADLVDKGLLTTAEFAAEKAKLLG